MEERESIVEEPGIGFESRSIQEEIKKGDVHVFEFPSFLLPGAKDPPYPDILLRAGGKSEKRHSLG